jgi:hypothetical protein
MKSELMLPNRRAPAAGFIGLAVLLCGAPAPGQTKSGGATDRVFLVPHLVPGQTLRYQLDFRSRANGAAVGVVDDPQGPREIRLSLGVVMRVDVLGPAPGAGTASVGLRLRSTYEKLAADVRADMPYPEAENIKTRMAQLEGKSFEFTMDARGRMRDVSGLAELLPGQAQAAQAWFTGVSSADMLPEGGIVLGEKWASEQDAGLPLAGVKWVRESTYVRNEPCRPMPGEAASRETCAVILTRSLLVRKGAAKDATPTAFSKQGLRTSGTAEGSSEALTYVSLTTGLVVSVTQTGAQKMNVTVALADGSNAVRYDADVQTETQLSLVSQTRGKP